MGIYVSFMRLCVLIFLYITILHSWHVCYVIYGYEFYKCVWLAIQICILAAKKACQGLSFSLPFVTYMKLEGDQEELLPQSSENKEVMSAL